MKEKQIIYLLGLTVLLFFALGDVSYLLAQEDEFTLEEITVTAQKREENQQKVPIAMEVISGEDLAAQGKLNIDDILKNVANVAIQNTALGMRVSLRGITDDSGVSFGQQINGAAVAINIDGAYNNMNNVGQNLYDIERVEVLFGPQSTLYGSNAPGGIVNVILASPKTDKFSFSATQEIGSYNLFNTQVAINAPIIQEKVALRFSGSRNVRDSYVQDDTRANNTKSGRLKALWNVYDKLSVTVTGTWSEMINGGGNSESVKYFDKQDGNWYTVDMPQGAGGPTYWYKGAKVTDPWTWDGNGALNKFDSITKNLNGEINWETPILNLSAVPSYSKTTSTGHAGETTNAGVYREYDQGRGNTQKGAELRMTNTDDFTLFQWIFGGTYYKSEQSNYQIYTYTSDGVPVADNTMDTIMQKKALYGNIVYPLWFNDGLRVTAGYRQSWDKANTLAPGPGGGDLTWSGNEPLSKPDWKFGIEYDVDENIMIYGNFATSYRSGNAMAQPDAKGEYPPSEELDAYTFGAKSRWMNDKLQVNVVLYKYSYKNKRDTGFAAAYALTEYAFGYDAISAELGRRGYSAVLEPDGQYPTYLDDGTLFTFDLHDPNSQGYGDMSSKGVDLQTTWILTNKDRVNLSISYLDEIWSQLHFHYYWYMIFEDKDFAGVTPANAPKWSITSNYEHNFDLGGYGFLTPRIDIQYKSKYILNADPTTPDPCLIGSQESYVKGDLSVEFSPASGKWGINAYCKNVTNYAVKTNWMSFGGSYRLNLGEPRLYGASLSVKF